MHNIRKFYGSGLEKLFNSMVRTDARNGLKIVLQGRSSIEKYFVSLVLTLLYNRIMKWEDNHKQWYTILKIFATRCGTHLYWSLISMAIK